MIIPAIIPSSFEYLEETLKDVAFAARVQIDVVDGLFVPNISWPYQPKGEVREAAGLWAGRHIEVDLMVKNPVGAGRDWLASGAVALIFHLETLEDPEAAIALRKEFDFELGIAIGNDTPLETLYPWIEKIDFVQLMGIATIGTQGQPFDSRVVERIVTLRYLYPNLPISIDGGVKEATVVELLTAGANRFVTGSAILTTSNPEAAYRNLLKITEANTPRTV